MINLLLNNRVPILSGSRICDPIVCNYAYKLSYFLTRFPLTFHILIYLRSQQIIWPHDTRTNINSQILLNRNSQLYLRVGTNHYILTSAPNKSVV